MDFAMFDRKIYEQRRAGLREALGGGLVLLPGNLESPMSYRDNVYPFRQDSTFLYFLGLDQPDLCAILDLDENRTIVFGDELTIDDVVWTGHLPTIAERAARAGVTETCPLSGMPSILSRAAKAGRTIHFLPPYRDSNTLRLARWLDLHPEEVEQNASLELTRAVINLRAAKGPEEIEQLVEAVDISVDMHTAAMRMARPGMKESEVAAEVERVAMAAGKGLAFSVIATVNGQILHNHYHGNTLRSGDLFLLDAGAQNRMGYCGDLSSTFPVDARFTEQQKIIYEISLAAHEAAVSELGPGVPNRQVHLRAARAIVEGMKDLGIMKGDPDDAVSAGAHAMFFPCGVGHMMGLDVHDMENLGEVYVGYDGEPKSTEFGLKSLRLARPLQPGFVLTIEPGIYFIPQLIDLWRGEGRHTDFLVYDELEKWRDFGGIRNEEDYLITSEGKRRLGKRKPQTIAEVEAIRDGS
jgi:Xaa-Pro aminopeptidase